MVVSATPKSKYWIGRARIGQGWAAFVGVIGDNAIHRHHAIQCFAGDQVCLNQENSGTVAGAGFVLPPDYGHRAESREQAAFLYIDPDTSDGQRIAQGLGASMRVLTASETSNFQSIVAAALDRGEEANPTRLLAALLGCDTPAPRLVDDRIACLIDSVSTSSDLAAAATAAASVGLSESRLLHLFKHEVGVPWRSFLLWTKLRRALEAVAAGATLTAAAHAGGFSDSAHFSRTCRTMFGINPHAMTRLLAFRR